MEVRGVALDSRRFYTRKAWVQNTSLNDGSSGTCREVEVGLVGLHIAHKTKSSPQWIWASFEHVDNVPLSGTRGSATFNDGSVFPTPKTPPSCLDAPLPNKPWDPGFIPCFLDKKQLINVDRREPIAPEIEEINRAWQQKLKGTWAHYQLTVVQWPWDNYNPTLTGPEALPTPPCYYRPTNTNLVNSIMETYNQPQISTCPIPPPKEHVAFTCMGCHGRTRSTDFIWALALNNNRSSAPFNTLSDNRDQALKLLEQLMRYRLEGRN